MRNLDNPADWREVVCFATYLGVIHAELLTPKLSSGGLRHKLSDKFGGLQLRNFHTESLRRAYGAGYIGVEKVRQAKARGW